MSMPSINLNCAKCDYGSSSRILWGDFKYIIDGSEYHVDRVIGWCFNCNELVAIEDFNNIDKVIGEIEKLTNKLKSDYMSFFSYLLSLWFYKDNLNEISELTKKLSMIRQRKGSEKCLVCGCSKIKFFNGDYSLEQDSDSRSYQGLKHTGFFHPDCGGEIIAKPDPIHFNMKFYPRRYHFDEIPLI